MQWVVHKKILRFHAAEQKFAFARALFGLLCLSQNETLIGLHKLHFRNTIWDRNLQLPTWHCFDLHCQSIYTWLWGLLCYRQQSCCSGTRSNFHCSTAQARGRVVPSHLRPWEPVSPKKGALLRPTHTWEGTAPLPSSCPHSMRYTCGCWHLLVLCWVCVTMSLCFFYSAWSPDVSHPVWQTTKKNFSDKSMR